MANERTGNYPGAVRAYERGLAVEPGNVELLNSLGFALFQQGKSKEAVVALEKALAIDPKHWKAHNNLALASIDLGELEVAEAHYRESLAIEPQPAIYNDLGFVLERQGLPEEAAEMYRKAIKLDPESASAHYNLGSSLARSGKFAEAERHLRAAIAADPKNASRPPGAGPGPRAPRTHRRGAPRDGDREGAGTQSGGGAVTGRARVPAARPTNGRTSRRRPARSGKPDQSGRALARPARVSCTTTGDSASSAIRFGIAISAFSVSAMVHARSRCVMAPKNTMIVHTIRYGMIVQSPTRYCQQRSP